MITTEQSLFSFQSFPYQLLFHLIHFLSSLSPLPHTPGRLNSDLACRLITDPPAQRPRQPKAQSLVQIVQTSIQTMAPKAAGATASAGGGASGTTTTAIKPADGQWLFTALQHSNTVAMVSHSELSFDFSCCLYDLFSLLLLSNIKAEQLFLINILLIQVRSTSSKLLKPYRPSLIA